MNLIYPSKDKIIDFFKRRNGFISVIDIATSLVVPHVQRSTPMDEEWQYIKNILHELKADGYLMVDGEGNDIYHEKFSSTPDRINKYLLKDSTKNNILLNSNSILKITLDNNCIINLFDFNAKTPTSTKELSEIIKLGLSGKLDIAITTRVESDLENDNDENRRNEMMSKLKIFPVIGTIARYGVSKWNSGDVWVGDNESKLFNEIQKIIFPGGLNNKSNTYVNKRNDIEHLVGHLINKRDIFITDDKDILKKQNTLKVSPGLIVMNPKECLEYIENIEELNKKRILQPNNNDAKYKSPSLSGVVTFDYSNNNGHYTIGEGYFLFETKWSSASESSIHSYNDPSSIKTIALAKGIKNIKDIEDASIFDDSSRSRSPDEGQIIILKNKNDIYVAIKIIDIKYDGRGDDNKYELTFEYFIQVNGTSNFKI